MLGHHDECLDALGERRGGGDVGAGGEEGGGHHRCGAEELLDGRGQGGGGERRCLGGGLGGQEGRLGDRKEILLGQRSVLDVLESCLEFLEGHDRLGGTQGVEVLLLHLWVGENVQCVARAPVASPSDHDGCRRRGGVVKPTDCGDLADALHSLLHGNHCEGRALLAADATVGDAQRTPLVEQDVGRHDQVARVGAGVARLLHGLCEHQHPQVACRLDPKQLVGRADIVRVGEVRVDVRVHEGTEEPRPKRVAKRVLRRPHEGSVGDGLDALLALVGLHQRLRAQRFGRLLLLSNACVDEHGRKPLCSCRHHDDQRQGVLDVALESSTSEEVGEVACGDT